MKKQILIITVIGLLTLSFNSLMAQGRPGGGPPQAETLTTAQLETVNGILSNYDSNAVTVADAKAIMTALKDAKIPGGKGIETAINNAGFDFDEIKKLAPPPSRKPRE